MEISRGDTYDSSSSSGDDTDSPKDSPYVGSHIEVYDAIQRLKNISMQMQKTENHLGARLVVGADEEGGEEEEEEGEDDEEEEEEEEEEGEDDEEEEEEDDEEEEGEDDEDGYNSFDEHLDEYDTTYKRLNGNENLDNRVNKKSRESG